MTPREAHLARYLEGWETLDAAIIASALHEDFRYEDPLLESPVTKSGIADYLELWRRRTESLGGTGEVSLSDSVSEDRDGALLSWCWWRFEGTEVQGAALIKTGDAGVLFERIGYFRRP